MPVISRNVPAFASSSVSGTAPGFANNDQYDFNFDYWRSNSLPAWLAYDLSGVPVAQRRQVVLAWYDPGVLAYQFDVSCGGDPSGLPRDYTIEANASPGGGSAPASGWVVLLSVSGNKVQSRQHPLNLDGYNWVRLHITAVGGKATRATVSQMDIHDASLGVQDSWIFYGDSITLGATNYDNSWMDFPINQTIAQQVSRARPGFFPAQEDAGIVCASVTDAVANIDAWLAFFPGRYVGLAYGTNDATNGVAPADFYRSYATVVQKVLAAGKIPIVPKIPWGKTASLQSHAPALNAEIEQLYADYPQIIRGPDFWTFFLNNPKLINNGDVHPTNVGYAQMRQLWAQTMLQKVYVTSP